MSVVPSYIKTIQTNKKAEVFSSAYSSMLVIIFAQPKGPTIMLEG
jgi:hypothetical protein